MADIMCNQGLGRLAHYATLPAANDALILVLLKSAGLEADATLRDHDDLAAMLAAANDECDATGYVRKTLAGVTVTVDDGAERVDIDANDLAYVALGGATNNALGAAVLCYDGDTTAGTDANVIPLCKWGITITTDGSDLALTFPAGGFARAS